MCVPASCCAAADGPSGLHRYKLRLLFDAVEMRWDWPVDVNYHEAQVRGRRQGLMGHDLETQCHTTLARWSALGNRVLSFDMTGQISGGSSPSDAAYM